MNKEPAFRLGSGSLRGFTLIEIMVVVAIMAVIMGISIPFAWHTLKRDAYNQTMVDLMAVFSNARAQAILQGSESEVVIHKESFEVGAPATLKEPDSKITTTQTQMAQSSHSGRSAHLTENVGIAALRINGVLNSCNGGRHVKFIPNRACDVLNLVVVNLENREMRGINLEVTTGLATIESDPNKLLKMVD